MDDREKEGEASGGKRVRRRRSVGVRRVVIRGRFIESLIIFVAYSYYFFQGAFLMLSFLIFIITKK